MGILGDVHQIVGKPIITSLPEGIPGKNLPLLGDP